MPVKLKRRFERLVPTGDSGRIIGGSSKGTMGAVLKREIMNTVLPSAMVVLAVTLIQSGSAVSHGLFPLYGPLGVLFLRTLFAGLLLALLQRNHLAIALKKDPWTILVFGICMAVQNGAFLMSIDRIPLGVAVTIEFIGPILTALTRARHKAEFAFILLGALGIGLLTPEIGGNLDPVGVMFAVVAGAGWASFIFCSQRLGRTVGGHGALPVAVLICSAILIPVSGWHAVSVSIAHPSALLTVMMVALFCAAIPLSLEYRALRTLKAQNYGVLVSAEPVAAMLIGFVVLGDRVSSLSWMAMLLITIASIGMTLSVRNPPPAVHD